VSAAPSPAPSAAPSAAPVTAPSAASSTAPGTAPSTTASGVLLVDKPPGITSHDAVARTRKLIGTRKVGHAGTLDPMATGLLVLGVNSSTRLLTWIVGLDKEYTATIRLGAASSTDDADGELTSRASPAALAAVSESAILTAAAALTGDIEQRPSTVSAIKVAGERSYTLAREGRAAPLAARPVTVAAFEVLQVRHITDSDGAWIDLQVRVECSTGTYIRALARDVGESLGVGGHLTALRRTRIGPFSLDSAHPLGDSLAGALLADALIAPADVARQLFPTVTVDAQQATDLTHGKRIAIDTNAVAGTSWNPAKPNTPTPIAVIGPDGRLVGLVELVDGRARVLVNFPTDGVLA